ncbi:MAG: SGNH/GDSL hydrolase family protein [Microbacteriaceae bacterium]
MIIRLFRTKAMISAATFAILAVGPGSAAIGAGHTIERNIVSTSPHPVVVAIGDSVMEGHGLNPDQAWMAVLARQNGWRFTNLASDGSGFVTVGDNGDTFADQAQVAEGLNPDVIILAGSSNDLGADDATIAFETTATIAALHTALPTTRIIAVSSIWGDTTAPAQLSAIDAAVQTAIAAAGGVYLDVGQPLAGQTDLMQSDDVHPTAAGQLVLAGAVEQAMSAAKLSF